MPISASGTARLRDQGRPQAAQEDEDHGHDQEYREHQGRFDIMDRGADGGGRVAEQLQIDAGRCGGEQAGQLCLDLIHGLDDVGPGDLNTGMRMARPPLAQAASWSFSGAVDSRAKVAHPDGRPVPVGQDRVEPGSRGNELVVVEQREVRSRAWIAPFGPLTVVATMACRRSSSDRPRLATLTGSTWIRTEGFCWPRTCACPRRRSD